MILGLINVLIRTNLDLTNILVQISSDSIQNHLDFTCFLILIQSNFDLNCPLIQSNPNFIQNDPSFTGSMIQNALGFD